MGNSNTIIGEGTRREKYNFYGVPARHIYAYKHGIAGVNMRDVVIKVTNLENEFGKTFQIGCQ